MTFAYRSACYPFFEYKRIYLTYLSVAVEDLPLPVALARRGGTKAGTLAHMEQACHLAAAARYYEILHHVSMHGRHFPFQNGAFETQRSEVWSYIFRRFDFSVQPMVDITVGDEKFFHRRKESVWRVDGQLAS
jgi:hypothetical protein